MGLFKPHNDAHASLLHYVPRGKLKSESKCNQLQQLGSLVGKQERVEVEVEVRVQQLAWLVG